MHRVVYWWTLLLSLTLPHKGHALNEYARLDTCVTVVDARHFFKDFASRDNLSDRKWEANENDQRTIAHLLIDQVEFADVIILNKTGTSALRVRCLLCAHCALFVWHGLTSLSDLVTKKELEHLRAEIAMLNADAKILESKRSIVPLSEIMNTKLFSLEAAQRHAGWYVFMTQHTHAGIQLRADLAFQVQGARWRASARE